MEHIQTRTTQCKTGISNRQPRKISTLFNKNLSFIEKKASDEKIK